MKIDRARTGKHGLWHSPFCHYCTQEGRMGDKDKTEKLLIACRDVFAELVNGLVYHGEEILAEEDMLPGPTESIYPEPARKLSSQFQDYSMYDVHEGKPCALYALENQGGVDHQMPLRCAGYEGAAYRRQYGLGSGQGIYPVISMVLNWGEKPCAAATSVRELLDYPVPRMAEDYLDKNRIHVFDMRFLTRTVRERFAGDIRVVLDYLCDSESMIRRNQKLRHPEEVMRMLYALSGDVRYLDGIDFMEEEGGRRVCELLDSMVDKGRREGMQEGIQVLIATYKELGITYEAAAAGVKEKYGLDDAEAQKDMKMYW